MDYNLERAAPYAQYCFVAVFIFAAILPAVAAKSQISAKNTVSNVEYFGFAGVDCGVSDPVLPEGPVSYTAEVAPFSNVAQLCTFNPTDNVIARLMTMVNNKMRPILDVSHIFYTFVNTKLSLRADYNARWNKFLNLNKLANYQNDIAAIYVVDEPFFWGLDYKKLETAVNLVKHSLPSPPIMFVESYSSLSQLKVPSNVSIVGFDQYQVDPLSADYKQKLAVLESKLSSTQRVVLVMDGEWIPEFAGGLFPNAQYEAIVPNYYTLAQSDPLINWIVAYSWPGGIAAPNEHGVRDFPATTQQVYIKIGKSIVHKP